MKNWINDGPESVYEEMISEAEASPEQFSQRTMRNYAKEMGCGVCMQPIGPWEFYFLICFFEDGKPQFIYQHMVCPRSEI